MKKVTDTDNCVFNIHAIEKQLAVIGFANSIFGTPTPEEEKEALEETKHVFSDVPDYKDESATPQVFWPQGLALRKFNEQQEVTNKKKQP